MKKLTLLVLLIAFSCNKVNTLRKNTESDKIEGEKITQIYFDNIKLEKPSDNLKLFGKDFLAKISKEDFIKQSSIVDVKLGKVIEKNLLKWETNIVDGTNPKSEYLFIYDVKREKYNSKETFYLTKEPTDSIKIHTYNVESEGLLKE